MSGSIELMNVNFGYEESETDIFSNMNLSLPGGVTTLIGQNGTGKSTLLLLAGGRLMPDTGDVLINGMNSRQISDEAVRSKIVSMIYQNMEFETEDSVESLLYYVYEQNKESADGLVEEIIKVFGLKESLGKKFQENSKGDMQKICVAFSLLYGSPYIMMDEPVFALEYKWKETILEYIIEFSRRRNVAVYYSIHELDLSQKYSDNTLLFNKDHSISMGPSSTVLSRELLEEAYQVPMELLYQRESLFRDHLTKPVDTDSLSGQNVKIID
ncbi:MULTISPECIES: ABC transporter ATP-binding protein [unclassified Oceanispirochaeta]|uniref:ATP-binding cassette domain-containing protein n=1 Tax=unclassified Oceanispirochaeta TaxID=2635722 RepID=UPI000E09DCE2|nr:MULTISPECIES: ABC transporter ATP-binding protein [unclassified Oceanispirochaeta]MBF9015599.1 ABC transporter ATP-binding protein [Oceanispirochaeta sp. M2]NPD73373.1 ABC transporter ATP-binding protein [Oceanispirochaeta sp. M1]RDG30850.1 ABC transporter ATP-binding protein [Oceanispirochaeta sp. M1]